MPGQTSQNLSNPSTADTSSPQAINSPISLLKSTQITRSSPSNHGRQVPPSLLRQAPRSELNQVHPPRPLLPELPSQQIRLPSCERRWYRLLLSHPKPNHKSISGLDLRWSRWVRQPLPRNHAQEQIRYSHDIPQIFRITLGQREENKIPGRESSSAPQGDRWVRCSGEIIAKCYVIWWCIVVVCGYSW